MRLQKRKNILLPLVFISLITAALGFFGILLDSFDVDWSDNDAECNK